MATRFYRFKEPDGSRRGLFRAVTTDAGIRYELFREGAWIHAPELRQYVENPAGAGDAVVVTGGEARCVTSASLRH